MATQGRSELSSLLVTRGPRRDMGALSRYGGPVAVESVTTRALHSDPGPHHGPGSLEHPKVPVGHRGSVATGGPVTILISGAIQGPVVIRSHCRTGAPATTDGPCRDMGAPPSRYRGLPNVGLWDNEGQGHPCRNNESLSRYEGPLTTKRGPCHDTESSPPCTTVPQSHGSKLGGFHITIMGPYRNTGTPVAI